MNRMRHLPFYSLLALCAFVSCERKNSAARAPEPSPSPISSAPIESIAAQSAQPSPAPTNDFADIAQSIRPAVIIVSVFDETGHLSTNGHGFFVSGDGKFIADRNVLTGGVNAVAKAAAGARLCERIPAHLGRGTRSLVVSCQLSVISKNKEPA